MNDRCHHAIIRLEEEVRVLRDVQRQLRDEAPTTHEEQQLRIRLLNQVKVEIHETVEAILILKHRSPAARARAEERIRAEGETEFPDQGAAAPLRNQAA